MNLNGEEVLEDVVTTCWTTSSGLEDVDSRKNTESSLSKVRDEAEKGVDGSSLIESKSTKAVGQSVAAPFKHNRIVGELEDVVGKLEDVVKLDGIIEVSENSI
ncbi:unnamed protein product [Caenorhabditis nigoni]